MPGTKYSLPMLTDAHTKTRTRLTGVLFTGNAIVSTAYIAVVTVSTLVSEQITGSTSLSGIPGTLGTAGVAAGAAGLSALSLRVGRRPSFTLGFAIAALGSVSVGFAIMLSSFSLLLLGMFAIGFGRSVGQLARYAAGDLRHREHRASAISLIVWASTIGALAGPLLIGPTSGFASAAGLDELIGPVTVGIVGFALGSMTMFLGLRPDPLTLAIVERHEDQHAEPDPLRMILGIPTVRVALAAMMISQLVMALIMVMTPLFIRTNNGSLSTVGWVMMAHTLGMFAIAPITGHLVDKHGPRRIIMLSVATLVISGFIAGAAGTAQTPILIIGLFLLGAGWNFGFVAGSSLLQEGLVIANRLKIQGFADSATWISGAVAAGMSGIIVAQSSYLTLSLIGTALALIPLIPLYRSRGR
jgi:MFS family permease